jgi:GAF domain-containing protein
MGRGPKPAKSKEAKPPVARKSSKNDATRVRDLEKRLAEALRDKAEALKREAEALEQQTATGEILRTIAQAPTDIQPVFDAVAANAARLCGVDDVTIHRIEDGRLRRVAHVGSVPVLADSRIPLLPGGVNERVLSERRTIHISDTHAPSFVCQFPGSQHAALGNRSLLATPLVREGVAIGLIQLRRVESRPFTDRQIALLETFADQAVIAIENVRLFTELQEKNQALTQAHVQVSEALEQQTAASEILSVISQSPTDVQPVFETIAENALRLCEATFSAVFRYDGELIHLAAVRNVTPKGAAAIRDMYPLPPGRGGAAARSILSRSIANIADVLQDPEYAHRGVAEAANFRSILSVPMVREGQPIGAITVAGPAGRPFPDKQVELLRVFADQAVIAIENVRLFTELEEKNRALTQAHAQVTESLDQQTATSEVLKVISRSAFELQPVLETLIESAVRLCGADKGLIYRQDGDLYRAAVSYGHSPQWQQVIEQYPIAQDRTSAVGRAVLDRRVVHIYDILADPEYRWAESHHGEQDMHRTILAVPMLREGAVIGVIVIRRTRVEPFTDKQIELVTTFADQAVIAIENVRLFTELQQKNGALTQAHAQVSESLEQQTATSEILEVMSQSQTDAQPVFEAIVKSPLRLCDGFFSIVYRFDGEMMGVAADHQGNPRASAALRALYPAPARRDHIVGRALLDRRRHHIADVATDPELGGTRNVFMSAFPYRTALAVPMLLRGVPIGAIAIGRSDVRPFTDKQIEVLETFADQAVIAIENVRLFKELEARTGELTKSVEKLTALSEVSRAVSSTLDVETVLDTIVSRANQLAGADACGIYEYNENAQMFQVRATHNFDAAFVARLRAMPLHKGEGAAGKATEAHEPIQIADIAVPGAYESRVRDLLIGAGYRALLSVPLVREEQIIGSLSLLRKMPGEYSPEVVEVLKTFATQSALAIQNARLFRGDRGQERPARGR